MPPSQPAFFISWKEVRYLRTLKVRAAVYRSFGTAQRPERRPPRRSTTAKRRAAVVLREPPDRLSANLRRRVKEENALIAVERRLSGYYVLRVFAVLRRLTFEPTLAFALFAYWELWRRPANVNWAVFRCSFVFSASTSPTTLLVLLILTYSRAFYWLLGPFRRLTSAADNRREPPFLASNKREHFKNGVKLDAFC